MRNVTLMEARAEKRQVDADLREHRLSCQRCLTSIQCRATCPERSALLARRAELAASIKTWFDPGPDQGVLP